MPKRKRLPKFPHQFLFFIGLRVRKRLADLQSLLVPAGIAVYEKAQGYWVSRAIYVACELNLADHLSGGSLKIAELARLCKADEKNLYRLMRALAAEGIFKELPGKTFENTRLSSSLTDGNDTIKYMILNQFNPTHLVFLSHLSETVRSGKSKGGQDFGRKIFDHIITDPVKSEIYNKSMDQTSEMISLALLSAYNFSGIKVLVDIGGGRGWLLSRILENYPGMKGVLFDKPQVIASAGDNFKEKDIQDRMEIVSGDFYENIPAGADAYFMKNILHYLDDEDCVSLLSKIRDAMDPDGRLIIVETLIKPGNDPSFGKRFDLLMMTGTEGGKERSKEEFGSLLDRSGLKISRIMHTVAPFSIIEAVRGEK